MVKITFNDENYKYGIEALEIDNNSLKEFNATKLDLQNLDSILADYNLSLKSLNDAEINYIHFEDWLIREIDSFGGEGQGDDYWSIIEVQKDEKHHSYWKIPGWYASFVGHELDCDDIFQVEKKQKVIDTWEPIQNK